MTETRESVVSRIAQWVVLVVLAAGAWSFVIVSGVLSRESDGGIFLSTTAGIRRGLPLYTGVWDNKDPLFDGAMALFASVLPVLAFVMDWFWLPVAAVGTVLIARRVVSLPTAVLLGFVATPLLLIGPAYVPGLTNTPGTAVALLCLGLLINRWYLWAGIAMGVLLFLKIIVFPAVLLCALALLAFPTLRRGLLRVGGGLLLGVVAGVGLMAVLGWLPGYATMLPRNLAYSRDAIVYFGYANSPIGHLTMLGHEWAATGWLAAAGLVAILVAAGVTLGVRRLRVPSDELLTVVWLVICTLGIVAALGLTYLRVHHAQALSLVAVMAVVVLAQLVEPIRWRVLSWILILVGTFVLSGWSTPAQLLDVYRGRVASFGATWADIDVVSKEAVLLNNVPAATFTFARLGTNDDRGFLWDTREGVILGCPEFHVYDFSPTVEYTRIDDCLRTVDVILKADSFDAFASPGNIGNVPSILDYVRINFTCIRLDDRELCTRKGS